MYGSERFTLSLPRPFPLHLIRPPAVPLSKPAAARNDIDDLAYRSELPQCSSAENSGEQRNELLSSSEMREFSSCFTSYVPRVASPSIPPFSSQGLAPSDLRLPDNEGCGTRMEGEGLMEDERKREREHKKRSKNWTRAETLKLIKVRSDIDAKFGRIGRKSELWDEIGEALQKDNFARDAQQCKDKWEKLSAGYKEVRDGIRAKEDFPYHDELHLLFSGRSKRSDRERADECITVKETGQTEDLELDLVGEFGSREEESAPFFAAGTDAPGNVEVCHVVEEQQAHVRKRKKGPKYVSVTDLSAVQELMETVLSRQQRFFNDLLEEVEKKEHLKEQLRQEREDKWRAEEREQRSVFNNAMIILTQQLLSENSGTGLTSVATSSEDLLEEHGGPKKRSKNWKRSEVLQLIKLRTEMDNKFAMPTRRAALWEDLAEVLGAQGFRREGKQCREKWDKLMAEFKDVTDGRRDQSESPFFVELKAFMEEGHCNT